MEEAKESEKPFSIPLEYNGEIKEINKKEAEELLKDGIIYKSVKDNYERLLDEAKKSGKSVDELICSLKDSRLEKRRKELALKCDGDSELIEHIIALESSKPLEEKVKGEADFKEFFPDISLNSLPESVLDKAKNSNTNILDEFLRYKAKKDYIKKQKELKLRENALASAGSLRNTDIKDFSPERTEFIKGLWR